MKRTAQLTLGLTAALGLLIAAIWLWLHNVIIVAAPVGALALGVGWATVDNTLIYPKERARRQAAESLEPPSAAPDPPPAAAPIDSRDVTVPR